MKGLILLVTGLFAGQLAFSQADQPESLTSDAAKPEFKFDSEEFNFGTIKQGDKADYQFVFTNTGKEPLVITSATGSCGCTVPEWPKEPIKKGEKGVIKVTFNAAGRQGMQDKTITIHSNARTNPKVLHVKGMVEVPAVAPKPN